MIPLKFIFNSISYYAAYLQSDAARIICAGSPIFRAVSSAFNNLTDLIKAIPPRVSLNSGLRKLFLYLKASNTIVKGTCLAAGYSQSAEVEMVKIPGVDPLSEGTIRRKKRKTNTEGAEKEKEKPCSTETGEPAIVAEEGQSKDVSEQAPQEENISTTSTTTVGASSATTSTATTPAASSMTSSGTKPKAGKPPTTPKENFDSTYLKENQCICGYEAADGHALCVHTKNQHACNYYRCWGLVKSSTTASQRHCPFETQDQGDMWRHYRTKHLGLYYRQCSAKSVQVGKMAAASCRTIQT